MSFKVSNSLEVLLSKIHLCELYPRSGFYFLKVNISGVQKIVCSQLESRRSIADSLGEVKESVDAETQ